MRLQIEPRLAKLQTRVYKHMQKSQARYKADYDRCVRETLSFQVGNFVIVDKPPLATTLDL